MKMMLFVCALISQKFIHKRNSKLVLAITYSHLTNFVQTKNTASLSLQLEDSLHGTSRSHLTEG